MAERKYCPECEEWVLTDETQHRCGYVWGMSDAQIRKRLAESGQAGGTERTSNENLVLLIIGIVIGLVALLLVFPRGWEYTQCSDECKKSYFDCMKSASDLARMFGGNSLGTTNCERRRSSCADGCAKRALRAPF